MTLYLGETLVVVAEVRDDRDRPVDPRPDYVVADFWAPGRDPEDVPAERDTPDVGPVPLLLRDSEWRADVPTDSSAWSAGRWTCRITAGGTFKNWDFFTFEIEE